jgi:tetratricopeptide (TPR) repeat protein
MKTFTIVAVLAIAGAAGLRGQEPANPQSANPQTLFDAGKYEEAISAITAKEGEPAPESIYLAGQSYLRLNRRDDARAQFAKLAAGVDPPTAWSLVGESATALADGNHPVAVEKASRAAEMAPDQFHPHYQLGLAHAALEQWEQAAAAFEKATTINPSFAYAHYHAGLMYSRQRQLDKMATHLEYFLKLAPEAPERAAVTSLMRSIRGR